MNNKKLLKLFASAITVFSLLLGLCLSPVAANDIIVAPTAMERYTKSVNVACHNKDYGYITVKVTISHNMTTGRMKIESATGTGHFNLNYPGLKYKSVTTNPSVGSIINGSSIKVTVYYVNLFDLSSTTWKASDYITV